MKIIVRKKKIDYSQEFLQFSNKNEDSGSIAVFLGKVRKKSEIGEVKSIVIENYKNMTKFQLKQIAEKVIKKCLLDDLLIIHRYGKILVKEDIVLVLVASRHREGSFKALNLIVDWLKIKVTFWKKEITQDSSRWVPQNKKDLNNF